MASQIMHDGTVIAQLVFTGIGLVGLYLAWSAVRANAPHTREHVSQPESIDTFPAHVHQFLAFPMVLRGGSFASDFFGYRWFLELLRVKFHRQVWMFKPF